MGGALQGKCGRLVTIMQTKSEWFGLAILTTSFFRCSRKEVPPPSCALKVDLFWVRGLPVVPPIRLLWQGARGVAGGVAIADTIRMGLQVQGAVEEVIPGRRSPGEWRSRGTIGRDEQ